METNTFADSKKNGVYYTPGHLAEFLVTPLIKRANQTIFDPAYGDGALLIAAEGALKKRLKGKNSRFSIYGCDIQPVNGRLNHLPGSNLSKQNFFKYSLKHQYDVIIMNPPYVRHHLITPENKIICSNWGSSTCKVKGKVDLWAYFLIKSVEHLKKGGSMGAILPWSFLQADYAREIRVWLLDKFEEIKITATDSEYFDGTKERVLLVWLKNYAQMTRSIKISFSRKTEKHAVYVKLGQKAWKSSPVVVSDRYDIEEIIQRYIQKHNFLRFGETAKIQIGVVTGADRFFILPGGEARDKCFREDQLIPILTSAKEFSGLVSNEKNALKRLIIFSKKNDECEAKYIEEGERQGYHLRAHSRLRTPWYAVNPGDMPDAFFPYRMAFIPYLMLNNGVQCTNSIHRIYFKNLSENEIKWLQLSLLTIPGQLAIETYSKTYGRGMLKIEPGALKNSIVYLSNDPSINTIYNQISEMISSGDKFRAMMMATEFLYGKLDMNRDHANSAKAALMELQSRRLNKTWAAPTSREVAANHL
jgi:adenine-specific DNA methylase